MKLVIWSWLVPAVGLALAVLLAVGSAASALAHGKDVTLEVVSFTPEPQRPLTRLYRVYVSYTDDKEPVRGAAVSLSGQRSEGGEVLAPVRLEPLNLSGLYAGQVTFPRYGAWEIRLEVKEPGTGETSFVEDVLPAALVREAKATGELGQRSIASLSLGFNWRDAANVGIRWAHALAALTWFGLSGLIVAAFGLLQKEPRAQFLGRLGELFLPVGTVALAVLAGTGIYNAIYNSPIRAPGVFSLETMERLPFGAAYLAAVSAKVLALVVMVGLAHGIAKGLRRATPAAGERGRFRPEYMATGKAGKVGLALPLAVANLALGLMMLLDVAVIGYLHNLSHLAISVQGGN